MTDLFVDPLEGELVPAVSADVAALPPLNGDQARELTETIRNAAEVLWVLIARAHAGRAWSALGYDTWEAYVRAEFDMSRSRSYQILDQARVIAAIEASAPDGTPVKVSAAAARDLKGVLDDVVAEVAERTDGLDPREAAQVIADVVAEKRAEVSGSLSGTASDEVARLGGPTGDGSWDDYGSTERSMYGDDSDLPAPVLSDTPAPLPPGPERPAPPLAPVPDIDVARVRRNVNAAHDIYGALSALAGLPDELPEIVTIIPAERHTQIEANLEAAAEKLARFARLWREHRATDAGTGDAGR
jgi:hypothetical protein